MGPRYDAGYGLLLLAVVVAFVVGFGVPLDPRAWPTDPTVFWPLVGMVAMFLGGLCGLVAARRPETTVAGRRVDHLTFRGLATLSIGVAMLLSGGASLLDGDGFGLVPAGTGAFMLAMGVGTMLRRPSFVSEGDLRASSAR
jgi:peptidoglycan/LPS O-acetylase OafA/YrhL